MDRVTPEVLYGMFASLSDDDRGEFLELLGSHLNAEDISQVIGSSDPVEWQRFWESTVARVRSNDDEDGDVDDVDDPEFESMADETSAELIRELQPLLAKAWAEGMAKRNRKPDPETIRRNVEICDLRKDRQRWSIKKLAKKYGVSDRYITKVTGAEEMWRKLAAGLRTE